MFDRKSYFWAVLDRASGQDWGSVFQWPWGAPWSERLMSTIAPKIASMYAIGEEVSVCVSGCVHIWVSVAKSVQVSGPLP